MIVMKIECTIPGKPSLLEFSLFIKFIISHKRRQIGHIFIRLFLIIFRRTIPKLRTNPKLNFQIIDTTPWIFHVYRVFISYYVFMYFYIILHITCTLCNITLESFLHVRKNPRFNQREYRCIKEKTENRK